MSEEPAGAARGVVKIDGKTVDTGVMVSDGEGGLIWMSDTGATEYEQNESGPVFRQHITDDE